jgi:hypothetical protein
MDTFVSNGVHPARLNVRFCITVLDAGSTLFLTRSLVEGAAGLLIADSGSRANLQTGCQILRAREALALLTLAPPARGFWDGYGHIGSDC